MKTGIFIVPNYFLFIETARSGVGKVWPAGHSMRTARSRLIGPRAALGPTPVLDDVIISF